MAYKITPQVGSDEPTQFKQNLAIQALSRITATQREVLTANRTYYVATTGSNTANDGLSSTSPFLTIAKAVAVICNNIDMAGFSITVSVAAGTYSGAVTLNDVVGINPTSGSSSTHKLRITGDTSTPSNVILNTGGTAFAQVGGSTTWLVEGFKFTTGSHSVEADFGAKLYFNACEFNSSGGYYLVALYGGRVESLGDCTISGSPTSGFAFASSQGQVLFTAGKTITLTGTPNFPAAFAVAQKTGLVTISSMTFTGSGTGTRWIADTGGGIDTNGGGATYLPGNAAGTTTNPGWYN